jgi:tetratricopeptide (TPR) repeat protein
MLHKKFVPVLLLACWTPFPSAHAAGEGAVTVEKKDAVAVKKEGAADSSREGVVSFKNTIGMISLVHRKGDYEHALELIELARQRPLGTSELVILSLYEGIILYELSRFVESGDAFQMALLIRPDAKLPEPVSPKIESHFETIRKRVQQEPGTSPAIPPGGKQSPSPGDSSNCPSGLISATGRTLKAQQLWRLAMMDKMLCVRGIRGGEVASILSALKTQVSQLSPAGSPTEWIRVIQEIDQFAKEYSIYPFNADWDYVKSLVPEERWEVGDEDQDVALPEAPAFAEEEPASLFGCRAAVALECERLMRRLLLLQEQLSRVGSADRFTARTELLRLGKKVREASSSEKLKDASSAIDAWQGRWH